MLVKAIMSTISYSFPQLLQTNTSLSLKHNRVPLVGRDSSVGKATHYKLGGMGIESQWGKIFHTRPDRPWGSPSLYNGYRVFPGSLIIPRNLNLFHRNFYMKIPFILYMNILSFRKIKIIYIYGLN
jgi:hypothetical protein